MAIMKPTDPKTLKPEQVVDYARKSVTRGRDGTNKSIADQHDCNQETADYYSLPLSQDNWLTEAKNHGGDEWWQKCPEIGLEWGAASDQPFRPILTKLIWGVITGKIKCVIVWSVDRLLREIAIAKILADLFAKHGCLLYDRCGNVPLDSPEARGNFFQTVLAAQQYREMCAVNQSSRRQQTAGTRQDRRHGQRVGISARQQGLHQSRNGGNRTCQAHFRPLRRWHEQSRHRAQIDGGKHRTCS